MLSALRVGSELHNKKKKKKKIQRESLSGHLRNMFYGTYISSAIHGTAFRCGCSHATLLRPIDPQRDTPNMIPLFRSLSVSFNKQHGVKFWDRYRQTSFVSSRLSLL